MSHDTLQWEQVLRNAGYRITQQRGVILDAVCAAGGHTSLGEVYARAHKQDPSLDRSTVYRALKVFMEVGLVVSADVGDGETRFEIRHAHPHHHLVCRACGAEQEIGAQSLDALTSEVLQRHGFEVDTDHLVLFGTCRSCRERAPSA